MPHMLLCVIGFITSAVVAVTVSSLAENSVAGAPLEAQVN